MVGGKATSSTPLVLEMIGEDLLGHVTHTGSLFTLHFSTVSQLLFSLSDCEVSQWKMLPFLFILCGDLTCLAVFDSEAAVCEGFYFSFFLCCDRQLYSINVNFKRTIKLYCAEMTGAQRHSYPPTRQEAKSTSKTSAKK